LQDNEEGDIIILSLAISECCWIRDAALCSLIGTSLHIQGNGERFYLSFVLKKEAACSFETLRSTFQNTWCHIPEDGWLMVSDMRDSKSHLLSERSVVSMRDGSNLLRIVAGGCLCYQ
jgi:hypothetical protein